MPLILGANSASGGYDLTNSLRFNRGSSDGLSKTFSSNSNRRTFTFSCWFKLTPSSSSGERVLLGGSDGTGYLWFLINSVGNIYLQNNPSSTIDLFTNQKLRDYSAWYHIVLAIDTTQATNTNRVKIYLNGSQITSFESPYNVYPSQNQDLNFTTSTHALKIGEIFSANYFDGYMSDVFYIDGQQLTPSSFGETDFDTGIWKPKAYTGTFGTNGFYLQFKNSSSLGTDSSGNGNTFTVNNLTSIDQTTDTPTNNFCTLNPLNNLSYSGSGTLTEGNLQLSYSGGLFHTNATIAVNAGKWFWETKGVSNMQQGTVGARIGFVNQDNTGYASQYFDGGCIFGMFWHPTIGIYTAVGATQTLRSSTLTYTDGDIIGIALDLTNNISYWYKNGTLSFTYDFSALATIGSYFICPALGNGSGSASPVYQLNFGNPPYSSGSNTDGAGYGNFSYAVPSGYYSLNTKNLANFG